MSNEPTPLEESALDQVAGGTNIGKISSSSLFIPTTTSPSSPTVTTTAPTAPTGDSGTLKTGSTTYTPPVNFK